MEEVESGGEGGQIPCDVAKAFCPGALETMCWYGISDLFDGEVGQVELIAIGIQQLPIHGFQLELAVGPQGRQGGRRGRLARGVLGGSSNGVGCGGRGGCQVIGLVDEALASSYGRHGRCGCSFLDNGEGLRKKRTSGERCGPRVTKLVAEPEAGEVDLLTPSTVVELGWVVGKYVRFEESESRENPRGDRANQKGDDLAETHKEFSDDLEAKSKVPKLLSIGDGNIDCDLDFAR